MSFNPLDPAGPANPGQVPHTTVMPAMTGNPAARVDTTPGTVTVYYVLAQRLLADEERGMLLRRSILQIPGVVERPQVEPFCVTVTYNAEHYAGDNRKDFDKKILDSLLACGNQDGYFPGLSREAVQQVPVLVMSNKPDFHPENGYPIRDTVVNAVQINPAARPPARPAPAVGARPGTADSTPAPAPVGSSAAQTPVPASAAPSTPSSEHDETVKHINKELRDFSRLLDNDRIRQVMIYRANRTNSAAGALDSMFRLFRDLTRIDYPNHWEEFDAYVGIALTIHELAMLARSLKVLNKNIPQDTIDGLVRQYCHNEGIDLD